MMTTGWTIVLDVGKTLSKASLWDEAGVCAAHRARANSLDNAGVSQTLDTAGIERWLRGVLAEFSRLGPAAAIVPVAHGAGVALIRDGRLQHGPLDYEWPGVGADRAAYEKQRDPFAATGSPALPAGLNLGMQLHWLESLSPAELCRGQIVPWAQYWAWLLCGVPASEVTSLGCHTDLWRPYDHVPSDLAVRRGWAERLGPLTPANAVLGTLHPEWIASTGLSRHVEVYCGMHDSNAALLAARSHPQIEAHDTTVLSTGTWFVAMRTPARAFTPQVNSLSEGRDYLVNVDISGRPIPSSRFMGGREIEILTGAHGHRGASGLPNPSVTGVDCIASAIKAIEAGDMILPTYVPGVGPFPNAKAGTHATKSGGPQPMVLAHLYAAMLADVCLDLIGIRDTLLVDGRFSAAPVFVQVLATLRPTTTVLISSDENGVAHGALRLANVPNADVGSLRRVARLPTDMSGYRARWREAAAAAQAPGSA